MAADIHFDTNCLLRLLLRDLPEQAEQVEQALKSNSVVHVSDAAIIEMVFVLEKRYMVDRDMIAERVKLLMSIHKINCNRALLTQVVKDYVLAPKVSFIDVCLAHYASFDNAKLLTFDKTLAKKLPKLVKLA